MSEVKTIKKQQRRKSVHYVNNRQLWETFVEYRAACAEAEANGKPLPQLPKYIGEAFMLICSKLGYKYNFINYSYRDEMVGDAIENCVAAAHNFDPNKSSNPFAYFTQVAWNAFVRRITKEKKQAYVKYKNIDQAMINDLMAEIQAEEGAPSNRYNKQVLNDSMMKTIESFESKNKLTKSKKKDKVGVEKFMPESTPPEYADGPRLSTQADILKE